MGRQWESTASFLKWFLKLLFSFDSKLIFSFDFKLQISDDEEIRQVCHIKSGPSGFCNRLILRSNLELPKIENLHMESYVKTNFLVFLSLSKVVENFDAKHNNFYFIFYHRLLHSAVLSLCVINHSTDFFGPFCVFCEKAVRHKS